MSADRQAMEQAWGPLETAVELPGGLAILHARPNATRAWHTWTTCGLRPGADGLELVTYADDESEWPAQALAELASLASLPGALQPDQVLDLGGPLDGGASRLTAVFLLPPYFEPEALWRTADGWLLWACPITAAEREYATMAGAAALEQALVAAALRPGPDLDRGDLV